MVSNARPTLSKADVEKLRAQVATSRTGESLKAVEERIYQAEHRLREMDKEWDQIPKPEVERLRLKQAEIVRWQIRRRTLVEVWELLTKEVWPPERK